MSPHPFRVPQGPVDLTSIPTDATPGFHGDKEDGVAALEKVGPELAELQERLFAQGVLGRSQRVLLVLQGMDTSGKDGTIKRVVGLVNPLGVRITSFGAPTDEERRHDFLWRIRQALPAPGQLGVFGRSHYEDVLVARVHGLAPPEEIERRYVAINDFERELVDSGMVIVKCMLHISPEKQKERLLARLEDPTKRWKYDPRDVDERGRWTDYRRAYEIALERTNTDHAPWYVVPSDRNWFRNLAVGVRLTETLRGMDLQWPQPEIDVEAERRRLLEQDPLR